MVLRKFKRTCFNNSKIIVFIYVSCVYIAFKFYHNIDVNVNLDTGAKHHEDPVNLNQAQKRYEKETVKFKQDLFTNNSIGLPINEGRFPNGVNKTVIRNIVFELFRTYASSENSSDININKSTKTNSLTLFPFERSDDRILDQLSYPTDTVSKLIYVGKSSEAAEAKTRLFEECGMTSCQFTSQMADIYRADAVFARGRSLTKIVKNRRPNQVWLVAALESPAVLSFNSNFQQPNWTATYRRDSTIVTPYEKFVPYDKATQRNMSSENYLGTKSKNVAWFISNCHAVNGRMEYATELAKYTDVDIYGACGNLQCPRRDADKVCFKKLKTDYKFYLAFENANCKDYITEKVYWNALKNDIIPVVMGAHPDDYAAVLPPHSYIHVDDFESPKQLAQYLQKVGSDRELYNSYFAWHGTGEFINTKFWCRLCTMVHQIDEVKTWYNDVQQWWGGEDVCVRPIKEKKWASWRGSTRTL